MKFKIFVLGFILMMSFGSCSDTYKSYTLNPGMEVRLFKDSTFMLLNVDFRDSIRINREKSGALPGSVGFWEGGSGNGDTLKLMNGYNRSWDFIVDNKSLIDLKPKKPDQD